MALERPEFWLPQEGEDGGCDLVEFDDDNGLRRTTSGRQVAVHGICFEPVERRTQFIVEEWLPFTDEARGLLQRVRANAEAGFAVEARIPVDSRSISCLMHRCMELTAKWYGPGKGNLSYMYSWFIKVCEDAGVSAYRFSDIKTQWSEDGFLRMIDEGTRAEILRTVRQRDARNQLSGSVSQQQGVSAIDNTVLNNVLSPEDARVLLSGHTVHRFMVDVVRHSQRRTLKVLSEKLNMDLNRLHWRSRRTVLKQLDHGILKKWGINPNNLSFRILLWLGEPLWSWGQIPEEDRIKIHSQIQNVLKANAPKLSDTHHDQKFTDFLTWCKQHPGEFYNDNKREHMRLLIGGLICGKVVVVRRPTMETFTRARYMAIQWRRQVDLPDVEGNVLRQAGSTEHARIRINESGYAEFHGMSLAGGGFVEQGLVGFNQSARGAGRADLLDFALGEHVELAMNMNIPHDPSARLENWLLIDVEKICTEAKILSPSAPATQDGRDVKLPGEDYFDVGQNPKVGSSIARTQHTQITKASALSHKIYQLTNKPTWIPGLKARLDLVQIGVHKDAFLVRVLADDPTYQPLLKFLVSLRVFMQAHSIGGRKSIDFNVRCLASGEGGFVTIMTPLAQLEQQSGGQFMNPDTKELSGDRPVPKMDTAKGAGQYMMFKTPGWDVAVKEGETVLRDLYNFCRKEGARDMVHRFLAQPEIANIVTCGDVW